jgi:DNA invertase Pin-like site-specific DNA recombinase
MRALLYGRFSTDKQSESSVTDQWAICEAYAKQHGLIVAERFSDKGISGASFGNRPGVQSALDALRPGDVLLISDLSRLSRSQDLAPALARLRHRNVRVVGVQDGFDSDSRTARMQAGMSGIMSEEMRSMIADRTHSSHEFLARDGKPTGGKAYENAEHIREIFQRFAAGDSLKEIAADFNERGIPSPGAGWKPRETRLGTRPNPRGKWLVSALHAILRNEVYVGRKVWNRSKWVKDPDTGTRKRRERPESEWIVRECQAIVDRVTWNLVQRRFRTHSPHTRGQRYLLSGLLECGVCGSKLVIYGGGQRRYRCGAHHQGGAHACANAHTFPMRIAEDMILDPVFKELLSDAAIALGVKAMKEEQPAVAPPPANRELKELQRLVDAGILSPEVAAPSIEAARRKAETNVTYLDFAMQRPSPAEWRATVLNMREVLEGDDVPAARDILRELVGPISCVPAGIHHVRATLAAREIMLMTGTGRFCGSGGALRQDLLIPVSSRNQ